MFIKAILDINQELQQTQHILNEIKTALELNNEAADTSPATITNVNYPSVQQASTNQKYLLDAK
ncbi:hypothetical protein [Paenibacillus shenyangensis]|uniref:hypothetical protein n=1 Tax=Paenibacillus sp. A9 TaxID=1284352 RepID=UPI000377C592|nr:hypothetical protein [Paenibacillus sp. A9]